MLSVLMGGVLHHHIVGENAPAHSVGGLVYLGLSIAVPVLSGADPSSTTGVALALAAVGWGMGVLARSLAPAGKAGGKNKSG